MLHYERLAAEIAGGRIRPVYLLAGPDAFQQRAVVDALRAALVPAGLADAVLTEMEGAGLTAADVAGAALTPSLAGRRLVVVRDVTWFAAPRRTKASDAAGGSEGDAEADGTEAAAAGGRAARRRRQDPLAPLAAYLERPAPDSVVVFRCQQPADSRRRIVRRIGEVGAVLAAAPPPDEQLPAWCVARARAFHGAALAPAAAGLLCGRVPASLDLLDQELAKLAAFVGSGAVIDREAVERLVAPTRDERVFGLMDAAVEGRMRDALALLATLRAQGEEPLGLLALLARQVRLLAHAADAAGAARGRAAEAALASSAGVPPFVARRALAQTRRFREEDLEAALASVWEAEWAIKTGRLAGEAALAGVVMHLAASGS